MRFFETLLVEAGRLPHLSWHQARLERTCAAHGIDRTFALQALIDPPKGGVWRCHFVYDASGHTVTFAPYEPRRISTLRLICDETIDYGFKRTDRTALEQLHAQRGDADDVLIVRAGLVRDTTIANVAFWLQGQWLTPEAPLLAGTARARLLDAGLLVPAQVTPQMARSASKVAVMNALSGFIEVPGGILSAK